MPRVFLSYRRDDSQSITDRIYDRLVVRFSEENVFKDVDNVLLGMDFRKQIDEAVSKSDVVLAVIGPNWVNAADSYGRRRLEKPGDCVRVELETALRRQCPTIPVTVLGGDIPQPEELPESLADLPYQGGLAVRNDPDFGNDMDRLIHAIEKLADMSQTADHGDSAPAQPPNERSSEARRVPGQKTLLWVEDDPFIRQRITPKLEDEGFAVLTAADAKSAKSIFAQHGGEIDLAILDVMMPADGAFSEQETRGGYETGVVLARWIQKQNADIPLVAFSLSTEHDATEWFLKHGASFVEKSLDGANLIDCVRTIVSGMAETPDADDVPTSVQPDGEARGGQLVGQQVGRYEIREVLGGGVLGDVYLGRDEKLGRKVVVKVPRRERFGSDTRLQQFVEKARTLAKLKHPGITSVHDVVERGDGSCCIVLEYVEGGSLREVLNKEKLTHDRTRELLVPIAESLRFAHKAGCVHHNIKPSNILIDGHGRPRLVDFGLPIHGDLGRQPTGPIADSLAYMAPEQIRGETHRIDKRADIWALGVVLYEMLVGRRPFGGDNRDRLVDEILGREPEPPGTIDDSAAEDLERICLKCLRKDVEQRYPAVDELLRDLDSQPPAVDWDAFLNAVADDRELADEIIRGFLPESFRQVDRLREALSADDAPVARVASHTLKGSLRCLGAAAGVDLAWRLEDYCSLNSLAEARELVGELETEVRRVRAALAVERPWGEEEVNSRTVGQEPRAESDVRTEKPADESPTPEARAPEIKARPRETGDSTGWAGPRKENDAQVEERADKSYTSEAQLREIEVDKIDGVAVAHVRPSKILAAEVIRQLDQELFALVDVFGYREVVISLERVEFMSSAMFAALIRLDKKLKSLEGRLAFAHVCEAIREVMAITRLNKVFEIVDDPRDYLNARSG